MTEQSTQNLKTTPLHGFHQQLKPRWAGFAGYNLPVSYEKGTLSELEACRKRAALFDVSHMGQVIMSGKDAARVLKQLTCANIDELKPNNQQYSVLLNPEGGIEDDLIISRNSEPDSFFIVINAGRKDHDMELLRQAFGGHLADNKLELLEDRALVALQGPKAADILASMQLSSAQQLKFMESTECDYLGKTIRIARCGYTGEDGFEISLPAEIAADFSRQTLDEGAEPAGLAARDLARLEAGLCLYGVDINDKTSPVEAGITFCVSKARRQDGDFNGAARILKEISEGSAKKLVGIKFEGRAPIRAGAEITLNNDKIGSVTSGSFSPSCGIITLAMIKRSCAKVGTNVTTTLRGKDVAGEVTKLPFVPHQYFRG